MSTPPEHLWNHGKLLSEWYVANRGSCPWSLGVAITFLEGLMTLDVLNQLRFSYGIRHAAGERLII